MQEEIESIFEVQPSMKDGSMDLSADKENVPVVEFKNVALSIMELVIQVLPALILRLTGDRLSV